MISLKDRDLKHFESIQNINPRFFRQQTVTGVSGYNKTSFLVQRPDPDVMLYNFVKISVSFTTQRIRQRIPNANSVPEPFLDTDKIYAKPFPLSNSMKTIDVTYNGHRTTYNNPTNWSKYVHATESTNDLMTKKFSTSGGSFPDYNGIYDSTGTQTGPVPGLPWGPADRGITHSRVIINDYVGAAERINESIITFTFEEPLMVGLHSPYELKHKLKPHTRYTRNSWLIPHVRQFGVNILFDNLPANSMVFQYGQKIPDIPLPDGKIELVDDREIQNLTTSIQVTWINPSVGYELPPRIFLPSWYFEEFIFAVQSGDLLGILDTGTIDTGDIIIHQIPNSVLIYATALKTTDYTCTAMVTDEDLQQTNIETALQIGSEELNLSFNNLQVLSNVNNAVLTDFTERQLYTVTEKNCNEIPFNFSSYVGGTRLFGSTPGSAFVYLSIDDLNVDKTSGKKVLNYSFRIKTDFTVREGYSFSENFFEELPQHSYNLYITFFFDNYYYELNQNGFVRSTWLTNII